MNDVTLKEQLEALRIADKRFYEERDHRYLVILSLFIGSFPSIRIGK